MGFNGVISEDHSDARPRTESNGKTKSEVFRMNLFGRKQASVSAPATPPSIDKARERVSALKDQQGLRGRAAAILVAGNGMGSMATAKREVTGN